MKIFKQILHPLRSAALIFNKSTCCLGNIYPIIIGIIKQYKIHNGKLVKIIDEIIKNIKYYTTTSPEQSFILLAYVLTPQGDRQCINRKMAFVPKMKKSMFHLQE